MNFRKTQQEMQLHKTQEGFSEREVLFGQGMDYWVSKTACTTLRPEKLGL